MFKRPRRRIVHQVCYFCTNKTLPDYKDVGVLRRFISERGKISGRDNTGVCAKHQRRLTISVKRARHLALLPFTVNV
ncbi:MAG: 30S ribosomal protein S18 [bacterium]|nr:30S ribosomal protein S18 [bacterium]